MSRGSARITDAERSLTVIGQPEPTGQIRWMHTAALPPHDPPAPLRDWLTSEGVLTMRMRARFGDIVHVRRLREHRVGVGAELKASTGSARVMHAREVELTVGQDRVVFARTLIPEETLAEHRWLADLGDRALGEALAQRRDVERGRRFFAKLRADEDLVMCACAKVAPVPVAGLWARGARYTVAGREFLVTEVFLPGRLSAEPI